MYNTVAYGKSTFAKNNRVNYGKYWSEINNGVYSKFYLALSEYE